MEEKSDQKLSEQQNNDKYQNVGLAGGLTLLSLPMVVLAAIIGITRAFEFVDNSEVLEKGDADTNEVE